jgi:uncharacterized protein (UPF0262 family)
VGSTNTNRIAEIEIDDHGVLRYSPEIEAERRKAVEDLITGNRFKLTNADDLPDGPYHVCLLRSEGRLILDIQSFEEADSSTEAEGGPSRATIRIGFHLAPMRRTIRDYFTICESYFEAGVFARPGRLEAIDAGRKALHNEGAQALIDRLAGKVELDLETARRLFTLICVLHVKP